MATVRINPVLRYVRQLASSHLAELSDAHLLERFALRRDEAAFAALVRRHGPLVLGVCRRVLRDWHSAEDCFQITFLLLARKAGVLARPEALGAWLYGVASRTARKAKNQAMRRRLKESQVQRSEAVGDADDSIWRDLRPLLDESVNGLPEKYRVPFVLHYLQGVTVAEVARRLGCPRGSIASRLARARQRLRARLTRRGLAGCLPMALPAASPPVPPTLVVSTTKAAALVAAGQSVGPSLFMSWIAVFTEGAFQAMRTTKVSLAAAGLVLAALFGVGAGMFVHRSQATTDPQETKAKEETPAGGGLHNPNVGTEPTIKMIVPPPTLYNLEREIRYLSLAEARAIALEQGTVGQPSLLFPGVGLDNLIAAPQGSPPKDSTSIRVLADAATKAGGIVLTEIPQDAQRAGIERNINQMLLNVEVAYWNLYGSYWNLHSREQGMRCAYEAWKIVRAKHKAGRVSLAAVSQAKGQYNLFRNQRLQAIDTVLDNERQLRAMLGMQIEDGTRLVPSDAPTLVEKRPDWEKALAEAMKNRPELRLARQDIKLAKANIQLAKENKRELSQVQLQLARASLVLQDQELKAERFLGLYYRRMSSGYAQIKAARAQRLAFATQLRMRTENYRIGNKDASLDLLLEAQRFWADALATEYAAIATYNNALAGWEYAKGAIMAHAHVRIAEEKPSKTVRAVEYEQEQARKKVSGEKAAPVDRSLIAPETNEDKDREMPAVAPSLPSLWNTTTLPSQR